jgi:poly(ADP-ribose) glycohydrolase ARH3
MSRDRFVGCLLGLAVGDAVAAPYEGVPAEFILHECGPTPEIIAQAGKRTLRYTDDTEMTIGVAEVLAEHGHIDESALVEAFARNYDPRRGYGSGARRVIEAMQAGADWRGVAATHFPGGSYGNGAAMRVTPVGLLFHADLDRVWEEARRSALPTHVHPLGIEGAQLLAVAVALAVRPGPLDRSGFYRELRKRATTEEFHWAIGHAARLRAGASIASLGNSLEAHRSVVTAIAAFTATPMAYETVIAKVLALGDDVDTLAAMAGALVGAQGGEIPGRLIAALEDGPRGRGYLQQLAEGLYDRLGSMA